jgi:hypothetical protein
MPTNHKPVNIDPFDDVAGQISHKGETHNVLHLNGADFRALRADGGADVLTAYAIAVRLVPTLGERVYELTGAQVGAIIAIADGRVADVESQFPNGTGPATTEANDSPSPA